MINNNKYTSLLLIIINNIYLDMVQQLRIISKDVLLDIYIYIYYIKYY